MARVPLSRDSHSRPADVPAPDPTFLAMAAADYIQEQRAAPRKAADAPPAE